MKQIPRLSSTTINEEQGTRVDELRLRAKMFAEGIMGCCPEGRERSLALTKLEETVMWATKSITLE